MAKARTLALLGLGLLAALALRVLASPRPIDPQATAQAILELRTRIALAGAVTGAGLAIAAVASQAQARDARVDASLAGPLWGALPALFLPLPAWGQLAGALAGALLVTQVIGRGRGGLPMVLTRGIAVAGAVVSLAALGLFLGPGLTATTALAFLHASLGGTLPSVTPDRLILGGLAVLAAGLLAIARWRGLLLARTGLEAPRLWLSLVVALACAGTVLVAGVVPGLGLLAVASVRGTIGEHPKQLVPGAAMAGASLALLLDGLGQALAWPGELPLGIITALLASLVLAWEVVGR